MIEDNQKHALARIRSNYSNFSIKEKEIADYILKNPKNIINHTINQVSDELCLADSTVFRFCQRIGFKGYQALKISLAAEIVNPINDIHEGIKDGDSTEVVSKKVFHSNINTLKETLKILDGNMINKAVELILGAKRVYFYGSGGSAVVAMDAYHKFIRSGINVSADLESHMQLMSASQLTKDDVAILISHSGSTQDMLDIIYLLNQNEVKTISITNFAKSPLTKEATLSLYTVSEETDFRSEALSSRLGQLSLIDALYTNVMVAQDKDGKKALQKIRQAISMKKV
ncbi:MurR/RpiR family transcriptional regulator [Pseudogracilibacillus sp. SO30301A]|uniref:MurR/RpiR family transcriptional regulator n=1 Tax=Pseudogracilibacillus sp. SO30301A TaxID=3098291 RepID=UPI00300E3EEE